MHRNYTLLALVALAFAALFVTLSCAVVEAPHLRVTLAALCWVPVLLILFAPWAAPVAADAREAWLARLGGAGVLCAESLGLFVWHVVLAARDKNEAIYIATAAALFCQALAAGVLLKVHASGRLVARH